MILLYELEISPSITFLVQDACGACANAAFAVLGPNLARKGRKKMSQIKKILKKNRSRIRVVFYIMNIYSYYVKLTGLIN